MADSTPPLRSTGYLHQRATLDVVLIVLAISVALILLLGAGTVAFLEIRDPAVDTTVAQNSIDAHAGTIIGALLGLVAGQAQGRREAERQLLPGGLG